MRIPKKMPLNLRYEFRNSKNGTFGDRVENDLVNENNGNRSIKFTSKLKGLKLL